MKRERDFVEREEDGTTNGQTSQPVEIDDASEVSPEQALRKNKRVRTGAECPYLDTISRQVCAVYWTSGKVLRFGVQLCVLTPTVHAEP